MRKKRKQEARGGGAGPAVARLRSSRQSLPDARESTPPPHQGATSALAIQPLTFHLWTFIVCQCQFSHAYRGHVNVLDSLLLLVSFLPPLFKNNLIRVFRSTCRASTVHRLLRFAKVYSGKGKFSYNFLHHYSCFKLSILWCISENSASRL